MQKNTGFENVTHGGFVTAKEQAQEPEIIKVSLVVNVNCTLSADLHELELVRPLSASPAPAL